MKCKDVLELMNPYIDEELSANDRKAVEAHIASCADCRSQLESLTAAVMAVHGLRDMDVPTEVSQALRDIALTHEEKDSKSVYFLFASPFLRYSAVAGAIAVAVIAFTIFQNLKSSSDLAFHGNMQQKLAENNESAPEQSLDGNRLISKDDNTKLKTETGLASAPQPSVSASLPTSDAATEGNVAATAGSPASDATDQNQLQMGSSTDPEATDWPEVLASANNYDRTSGDILLDNISKATKNIYTVKDAAQLRKEMVDGAVEKITTRGGSGEAMRKPLDALLDETKRDALPVYLEKARFKGADCWLIIIRWGFGSDSNELNKTSLYVTDITGWKTLYYQSQ